MRQDTTSRGELQAELSCKFSISSKPSRKRLMDNIDVKIEWKWLSILSILFSVSIPEFLFQPHRFGNRYLLWISSLFCISFLTVSTFSSYFCTLDAPFSLFWEQKPNIYQTCSQYYLSDSSRKRSVDFWRLNNAPPFTYSGVPWILYVYFSFFSFWTSWQWAERFGVLFVIA